MQSQTQSTIRHDWQRNEVEKLFQLPFADLIYKAHLIHRENFDPNCVQISTLLSIKTGGCPEDCAYCQQSSRYKTTVKAEKLMDIKSIVEVATRAKELGASRFCMGAAWRNLKDRDLKKITAIVKAVKELGLEVCVTLGMLTEDQAVELKNAGVDFYNHNLDTSENFYNEIITTRSYQDRLDTLNIVRKANIKVCCGGILGMGETRQDRIDFLMTLAKQDPHPESAPINLLARLTGTPLQNLPDFDRLEFIRSVAVARIMLPKSYVRLSAGRDSMSEEMQALCFFAGANSIHYGESEKLLTISNPSAHQDQIMLQRLGITPLELNAVEVC